MPSSDKAFMEKLKTDFPAGIAVFFVALPLCLGIALASGAPPLAGIISGAVGGIIVGFLSGSALGVSGPAAGLTLIVAAAVANLSGWDKFVPAVILSGCIQLVFGYIKAGVIAYYFPSSVIKGMLSAIGITIILKQLPHAFGVDKDWIGDFAFWQDDGLNTFTEITGAFAEVHPGALLISITSLLFLIGWDLPIIKRIKVLALIPGALLAVVISVILVSILKSGGDRYVIDAVHFVNLPTPSDFNEFKSLFSLPDFNAFAEIKVWKTAFIIALVASIETLLCLEATDKLDPQRRISPANRELKAQGIGNILSGLLGGLPLTQVIVRSSANIQSGGRTKISTIVHGIILLLCALFIPGLLNQIPNAALAGLLILVGYKLAKPSLFKQMYKAGWRQFIPFIITIIAILFSDLLVGIGIGMIVGFYYILRANYKSPYYMDHSSKGETNAVLMRLSDNVSFLNKASILQTLEHIPQHTKLIIDARRSTFIDDDVAEIISEFKSKANERNILVEILEPEKGEPLMTRIRTSHAH